MLSTKLTYLEREELERQLFRYGEDQMHRKVTVTKAQSKTSLADSFYKQSIK